MAEVSGYIPGPYQGVSQAPPQVRLAGTCDVMEDCFAVLPQGIQKRPPLTWLASLGLTGDAPTEALIQEIPVGSPSTDVTLVLYKVAGVVVPKLFLSQDMSPISITVSGPAQTYLSNATNALGASLNCSRDLRAKSVEDVTFITNRTVPVGTSAAVAPSRPFEAIIWVKSGGYARTYSVTVTPNGGTPVNAIFATSTGASAADVLATGTDRIALALFDGTDPSPSHDNVAGSPLNTLASQGYTVTNTGSIIYISHPSVDFTIVATDDQGGTGMTAIKSTVQRFSDLPELGQQDFTVKIAQSASGGNSDYYVAFQAASSTTVGVWEEVVAPGASLGYDKTTLPVGITNTAGTWALVVLPWVGRTVGDTTLSLDPSFVGETISSIAWWKGRLGFSYNGGVSLTASDSPYKWYTTTLAAALDSDPIDLLTPADEKTFFKELAVFDQRLIAVANKVQAVVSTTTGVVTPSSTAINQLSDTDYSDQIHAQASNHKLYYMALRTSSAVIYEMGIDRLSGLALPEDMTPAVPTYIPATIDRAASLKTDYISIYGTHGTGRLIVHCYRYSNQERVQNSFYNWNLPPGYTLCGMFFRVTTLNIFVVGSAGTIQAFTMDLSPDRVDPGGTFLTYLDLRITEASCTVTYDAPSDTTTVAVPFPIAPFPVVAWRPGSTLPGYLPEPTTATGTSVTIRGDHRGVPLWVGSTYNSTFTPTRIYMVGPDGRPQHSGRLSLRRLKLDLANFGGLTMVVNVNGRAPRVTSFEGLLQDSVVSSLDAAQAIPDVSFTVPINGNSADTKVTFMSSSHLGFKLLGYEWEGEWSPRAQRVT